MDNVENNQFRYEYPYQKNNTNYATFHQEVLGTAQLGIEEKAGRQ